MVEAGHLPTEFVVRPSPGAGAAPFFVTLLTVELLVPGVLLLGLGSRLTDVPAMLTAGTALVGLGSASLVATLTLWIAGRPQLSPQVRTAREASLLRASRLSGLAVAPLAGGAGALAAWSF